MTVGGIITEAKRIRTRNGDPMMFATLDDLGGAVEMLVFGKALAEHEAALAVDEVVLVRGRVDHKEAGKTCLIVQTVEVFAPSEQEIERGTQAGRDADASTAVALAKPVHVRVDAADLSPSAIEELKQLVEDFPGPAEVVLEIDTPAGVRRLRLGEAYPRAEHADAARRAGAALARPRRPRRRGRRRLNATSGGLNAAARLTPSPTYRCGLLRLRARSRARAASSPARLPAREGPSRFSPGVSSTHGSFCRPGADRNAAQPCSPSSPSPMLAWRSRLEPSGVCESLRCSERTRPRPSLRVHSRRTERHAGDVRMS